MRYAIEEHFIDRVEKKLNRIATKCRANGNSFVYHRIGEEIRESVQQDVYMGKIVTRHRFIIIEVEGIAKVGNFELVAALEIHNAGNVIRRINKEINIPDRFRHSDNVCEHCKRIRNRKELYIVHNLETDEFKQVGSACLMEHTSGMDAEYVASYMDSMTELEAYDNYTDNSIRVPNFYSIESVLGYAVEVINKIGYFNASSEVSTKRVVRMLLANSIMFSFLDRLHLVNKLMRDYRFDVEFSSDDFHKPETEDTVRKIIEYYKTADDDSEFIHNAKIILADGYVNENSIGFITYLPEGYNKYIQKEIKRIERIKCAGKSEYYGEVNKRYKNVDVFEIERVAAYDSDFGKTYVYKIILRNGEILIWRTSSYMSNEQMVSTKIVTFTVKNHGEYRGEKQTEITRAKVA